MKLNFIRIYNKIPLISNNIIHRASKNFSLLNNSDYHISQINSFKEELILVDEKDKKISSINKFDGKSFYKFFLAKFKTLNMITMLLSSI